MYPCFSRKMWPYTISILKVVFFFIFSSMKDKRHQNNLHVSMNHPSIHLLFVVLLNRKSKGPVGDIDKKQVNVSPASGSETVKSCSFVSTRKFSLTCVVCGNPEIVGGLSAVTVTMTSPEVDPPAESRHVTLMMWVVVVTASRELMALACRQTLNSV